MFDDLLCLRKQVILNFLLCCIVARCSLPIDLTQCLCTVVALFFTLWKNGMVILEPASTCWVGKRFPGFNVHANTIGLKLIFFYRLLACSGLKMIVDVKAHLQSDPTKKFQRIKNLSETVETMLGQITARWHVSCLLYSQSCTVVPSVPGEVVIYSRSLKEHYWFFSKEWWPMTVSLLVQGGAGQNGSIRH